MLASHSEHPDVTNSSVWDLASALSSALSSADFTSLTQLAKMSNRG